MRSISTGGLSRYKLVMQMPGESQKLVVFDVITPLEENDSFLADLLANKGIIFLVALAIALFWQMKS